MIVSGLIGFLLGGTFFYAAQRFRLGKFEKLASAIIHQAEIQAIEKRSQLEITLKEKQLLDEQNSQQERQKQIHKEAWIEAQNKLLEKKQKEIEKKELLQKELEQSIENKLASVKKKALDLNKKLEELSGISEDTAKDLLLTTLQEQLKTDSARFIRRHNENALQEAETCAARIIAGAIQRMGMATVSEISTCTVNLPSEELKGRIIGREGRNIRALEKLTGVSFIMDDTPQAIVISSYDPLRRHIAKITLTDLISDGRIHPTRIEEAYDKALRATENQIKKFGEDAGYRIGVLNFHPEITTLLGKLKFRYSLGQNVLDHSLEVAHLMGIMAEELGLDPFLAKRIGLLHDIGKAVSHEIPGTHALIGQSLALKYGESTKVANGIGCHHFEIDPITIEGSLCNAADSISASRPGARLEAAEEYVRRLTKLEGMALAFPGVEKAYALQAGKELRVIAIPDQINDDELALLAKNLTAKIQKELDYPGKIKITVMREKRVIDYAM